MLCSNDGQRSYKGVPQDSARKAGSQVVRGWLYVEGGALAQAQIRPCTGLSRGGVCMQFEAFARGFMMLCGGPAIHLFSATELERLVCGNPLLDFAALQANARYDGGYSADHRVRPLYIFHIIPLEV